MDQSDDSNEAATATAGNAGPEVTRRSREVLQERWGSAPIEAGYTVVPTVLLEAQHRLGLEPMDLNVLLQIVKHWWSASEAPRPGRRSIAECIGVHERTVQRAIGRLEGAGFLRRVERRGEDGRQLANGFDLSGLVEKLEAPAREALQDRQNNRDATKRRRSRKPLRRTGAGGAGR